MVYIGFQFLVPVDALLAIIVQTVLLLKLLAEFALEGQQFFLTLR